MFNSLLDPAFILLGTAVTWLEVIAFVLALANIVCNVREIHWAWPLAFIASLLYVWLFAASKLYGEASVNVFFAATAMWGWWQWLRGVRTGADSVEGTVAELSDSSETPPTPLKVASLNHQGLRLTLLAWALLWLACSAFLYAITDSDVPVVDGFVTAGSIVGTFLLGRKFIENWPLWLIVNAASVALFIYKGLLLTAILYTIFFALAVWGWRAWSLKLVKLTT